MTMVVENTAVEGGPVRYTLVSVALIILGSTAGILFGYDTGVVSGAMLLIKLEFNLDSLWHEFIVSGTVAAAWLSSYAGGYSLDRVGRRGTILVAAVVFTVGAVVMAASPDKEVLLVGRVVVGVGVGLASVSTPVYLAETSPPEVRGRVITLYNVGITFGQFAASVVCGIFADVAAGWRWMLGLAGAPSALLLLGMLLMPESPRWLVAHDRAADAETSLRKLRGSDDVAMKRELDAIHNAHLEQAKEKVDGSVILRIFTTKSALRPLLIASTLLGLQQLAGINTVMYYSASIIQMAGIGDASQAIWLSAGVNLAYFVFGFVGTVLIERSGRRLLLLGSITGVFLSLVLLSAGFILMDNTSPGVTEYLVSGDGCAAIASCSDCMYSTLKCGFCYTTGESNMTSWCRAMDESNLPLDGSCEGGDVAWAAGWCPSDYSWIAVLALLLYLATFAPGMASVPWAINAEVHPTWARGVSGSIATSSCWIFNLLVSLTFLTLLEEITPKYAFLVYAALALVTLLFIFFFVPETQGVRLEDMDSVFNEKAWKSRRRNKVAPAVGDGGP